MGKCDIWSLGVIAYILLCGYAPFQGNCGQQCGWERGDKCNECQDLLFSNIKQCNVIFPNQQWAGISDQAKDLIQKLLVKDSSIRLTAEQVLSHPWLTSKMSTSSVILHTPIMLNKHQESIKNLEEVATKIMEANRALETASTCPPSGPIDIPAAGSCHKDHGGQPSSGDSLHLSSKWSNRYSCCWFLPKRSWRPTELWRQPPLVLQVVQ